MRLLDTARLLALTLLIFLSPLARAAEPLPSDLPKDATVDDLAALLIKAKPAGQVGLTVVFIDPARADLLPRTAIPIRVAVKAAGERVAVDAYLLSAAAADGLIKQMHQVGGLTFRGGRLRVGHPSGPGSAPPARPAGRHRRGRARTRLDLRAVRRGRKARQGGGPSARAAEGGVAVPLRRVACRGLGGVRRIGG